MICMWRAQRKKRWYIQPRYNSENSRFPYIILILNQYSNEILAHTRTPYPCIYQNLFTISILHFYRVCVWVCVIMVEKFIPYNLGWWRRNFSAKEKNRNGNTHRKKSKFEEERWYKTKKNQRNFVFSDRYIHGWQVHLIYICIKSYAGTLLNLFFFSIHPHQIAICFLG